MRGGAAGEKSETVSSDVETSAAENKVSDDPNVLADNDLFKVTLIEKSKEPDMGYTVLIENKSDMYISVDIDNSSVDGLMTGLYFDGGGSVSPGKKLRTEIRIFPSELEKNPSINLKNVEGIFMIATNTDGGKHYTFLRDTFPFSIPDNEAGAGTGAEVGGEAGADKIETISADEAKLTEK